MGSSSSTPDIDFDKVATYYHAGFSGYDTDADSYYARYAAFLEEKEKEKYSEDVNDVCVYPAAAPAAPAA
jgi:hypothetical protein